VSLGTNELQSDALAPRATMKSVDPRALSGAQQYSLLTGSVVPRPIALVTTLGANGPNAAPFSFFNVIGVDPPMVLFSVGMRAGADKDTVRNLKSCPELVIHIVDQANAEKMNICSTPFPHGVNEIEAAQFETIPSEVVGPPRIRSCPVHFECVLERILPFGAVPYNLVIAQIVRMHFRDDVVDAKWHIDMRALDPIARVTGPGMYARTTDLFKLPSLT
jgi:flavin reductase (DIM6/NTAB) family NADH-FMN oxidoreductase RutF